MPQFDETVVFPVLIGVALLFFLLAQVLPQDGRLRRFAVGAFGFLVVGTMVLSILAYLAELTSR